MKGCSLHLPNLPSPSLYWVAVLKIRGMNMIYPLINSEAGSQEDPRISELAAGAEFLHAFPKVTS